MSEEERRAAYDEIDLVIAQSSLSALAKINTDMQREIYFVTPSYHQGWHNGFRRCLAEVKRALEKK